MAKRTKVSTPEEAPVPAVSFTIYGINEGFNGPELESTTVERTTSHYWWLAQDAGLAFGCRTMCEPGRYPRTPREAWERYRKNVLAAIADGQEQLAAADKALAQLMEGV